ncbi:TPA: branched-chain amino acid transport system II carrier protein, partial [Enterococcus faecium]
IFVVSLFQPMGNLNQSAADSYQTNALTNGVLEGYNTVDAVALLALSVTFVHAVRDLGFKDKKVTELTAKAGSLSVALEVMIYFGLVLLGAMSLNKMPLSENGGTALSQITNFYLGNFGASFLGVMVTLGVFTTAMGLVVSFAQDFHKLFPKVSYMTWLRLTTFVSFVVANAGLDNIIQWSLPVLMLLYPLSLALILLSLTAKFFQKSPFVYQVTMFFSAVPAVLDMLANSPALVSQQTVVASLL